MPEFLLVRETIVHIELAGFGNKTMIVVTTILDTEHTTKDDLANLYHARWNNELDFRSLKTTMQMDNLRCKTPELMRKEVWTHALAYNLIRTIIAQAASKYDCEPRSISFKGAVQTLEAFNPSCRSAAIEASRSIENSTFSYLTPLQLTKLQIVLIDLNHDFERTGRNTMRF